MFTWFISTKKIAAPRRMSMPSTRIQPEAPLFQSIDNRSNVVL